MKATSRCFASGTLSAVIVACALVLPTATLAAPGEWTSTYDWQASPTTGFGGWGTFETYAVGPGGYYSAFQNGPLGLGLSMRPTGGRVYSNANPNSEVGGPKQVWQLNAPGTTRIRQGTFDHVDYAGTGERQFLRLALYGDDIEDTKYDYTPPDVNDDGPRVVTRPPFQPGAQNTQLWLYTSCPKDPPSAPAACPFVPNPSNSKGRVGKVVLEMTDPESPSINAGGPLVQGGGRWTTGQGQAQTTLVASDPGSGVANVAVTAASPGRAPRSVSRSDAPCDPSHSQPQPAGREAAVCPETFSSQSSDNFSRVPEGATTYTATATDLSQRTGSRSWTVRIDRSKPTRLTGTGPLTRLYRKWTNSRRSHALIASASDGLSGVARLEVRDGSTVLAAKDNACVTSGRPCPRRWSTPLDVDLGRLREGRHRLSLRAGDIAGNVTQARSLGELLIDRTAPTAPRGRVHVSSNGTTARWSSSDTGSRLDYYRVRVEMPNGRTSFRSIRLPEGGRESTTRSARLFEPGVKAAGVTVAAHDHAGNVRAARIRCKVPYSLKYCAQLHRRAKAKKRKAARRKAATRRRLSRRCQITEARFARATEHWGKTVGTYSKSVDAKVRAVDFLFKGARGLRSAAQVYERRVSRDTVTSARSYHRAEATFERARRRFHAAGRVATQAYRKMLKAERVQRRAASRDRREGRRSCLYLTVSQARRIERSRSRWNAGVKRANKRRAAARKTIKNLAKRQVGLIPILRAAAGFRGRGLLKTTSEIAQQYQPIVHVDRSDGFWPVRFDSIYGYRRERESRDRFRKPIANGFKETCVKDDANRDRCLEPATPGTFASSQGDGKHLDYPAPSASREKQHDMLMRATGGYGQRPAMYYFRTLGERNREGARSTAIEYWSYYTFNYLDTSQGVGGRHEGDFEHTAIVLSRKTGKPRYVFMARHGKDEIDRQKEPLRYPYDPSGSPRGIAREGTHIKLYAAHGSHASYAKCGKQKRSGVPDDHTCQGPVAPFGTTVPLLDLTRSRWSCWEGKFGEQGPHRIRRQDGEGPKAPLRQQKDYYQYAEPCRIGVAPPTGPLPLASAARAGSTSGSADAKSAAEPSLGSDTAPRIDTAASLDDELADEAEIDETTMRRRMESGTSYDRYFDTCDQWRAPPTEPGVKVVACDQRILTRFFENGLEEPGPENLRIVDLSARTPGQSPQPAIPAVYDTADGEQARRLAVTSDAVARPAISVAQQRPDGSNAQVRFPTVDVSPNSALRVRTDGAMWTLVNNAGKTVARARPTVRGKLTLTRPTQVRARQTGRRLVVRWRARREPTGTRFVVLGRRGHHRRWQQLVSVKSRADGRSYRRVVRSRPLAFVRVIAVGGGTKRRSAVAHVKR